MFQAFTVCESVSGFNGKGKCLFGIKVWKSPMEGEKKNIYQAEQEEFCERYIKFKGN